MGKRTKQEVVSYRTLRRLVGWLGILLPLVLVAGCVVVGSETVFRESVSAYYGSEMRNVLVGFLFAVGTFLLCYEGYDWRDDVAGNLACLFMLGVALFPITSETHWVRVVHLVSAGALFSTLAVFSLYLFRLSDGAMTPEKARRNRIYLISGLLIVACILAVAVLELFFKGITIAGLQPVFWLEGIALWAFGGAWLLKGERFRFLCDAANRSTSSAP